MKNKAKETKERLTAYGSKYENKSESAQQKAYQRFVTEFKSQKAKLSKKGINVNAKLPSFNSWKFLDKADFIKRRDAMFTGSRKTMGNRQRDIVKTVLSANGQKGGSIPGFKKLLSKYGYKATLQEIKFGKWNTTISELYKKEKEAYAQAHPELDVSSTGFGSRFSESFSQEWFDSL